jgi:hypothetical protein
MTGPKRNRLQIELSPQQHRFLRVLGERMGSGGDAETARRVLDVVENVADRIQDGYKLAVVSAEDEHPDAAPELTRALRPQSSYSFLIQRPHRWRKQLSFKGHRLTVGQFLGTMPVEGWTAERAAQEFDLPIEAALEAIDYGEKFRTLIDAETAEDATAAKNLTRASSTR